MKNIFHTLLLSTTLIISAAVGITVKNTNKDTQIKPEEVTADTIKDVNYVNVEQAWNPGTNGNEYWYAVRFDQVLNPNKTAGVNDNVAGQLGDSVTFNGESFISKGCGISYYFAGNFVTLAIPKSLAVATNEYPTPMIEIKAGTIFENCRLPHLKFSMSLITFAIMPYCEKPYATFRAVNGTWNPYPSSNYYILEFNETFKTGGASDVTNLLQSIGMNFILNGQGLVTYATYAPSISYANGNNYLTLQLPLDLINSSSTLHIQGGTEFYNYSLPSLDFTFNANKGLVYQRSEYNDPSLCTHTTYKQERWGNVDYGGLVGSGVPANGYCALLEFNDGIRPLGLATELVPSNDKAYSNISVNGTALSSITGSYIYYFQNFVYIYFPKTAVNTLYAVPTLKFAQNTVFAGYVVDAFALAFDTSWKLVNELEYEAIQTNNWNYWPGKYNDRNGLLLRFASNISGDSAYSDGNNYNVNFVNTVIGGKVKLNGTPFNQISGTEICVFSTGLLWIYAPNHYQLGNVIEIEKGAEIFAWTLPHLKFKAVTGVDSINAFQQFVTVTFNTNGGDEMSPADIEYNSALGSTYNPTKYDCAFTGWQLNGQPFSSSTLIKDDITLVATWVYREPIVVSNIAQAGIHLENGHPNGMSFETHLDYRGYNDLLERNVSNLEFGLYFVVKSAFDASSYEEVGDYIANTTAGSKTYAEVPNRDKGFLNSGTAQTDGYYSYKTSLINIKEGNWLKEFIPVSYLKYNGNTYYGQTGSYATSYYEVANSYVGQYPELSVITNAYPKLTTNAGTYGMQNALPSANCTFEYVKNGYYKLTATADIKAVIVDGKVYKMNIASGSSKYLINENYGVQFKNAPESLKFGFAEPNAELYTDGNTSVHSNAANNSTVISTFNGKTARIWLETKKLMKSAWFSMVPTEDSSLSLNPETVAALKATINSYRNAGAEEILLMMNGLVHDAYHSKVFYIKTDHVYTTWYGWAVDYGSPGTTDLFDVYANTFPDKNADSDEYAFFTDLNKEFYKLIGQEFEGYVDCIECMNEINLGAQSYSREYRADPDGYLASHANIINLNSFAAEYSMDYCKMMTDGIKEANSTIKVLSPAMAPVNDTNTGGIYYVRDGYDYFNKCYQYMQSKGGHYNDYFQGLNLHPYMFASKEIIGTATNVNPMNYQAYLYETTPEGKSGFSGLSSSQYNSNYDVDWSNYMDSIHTMAESYGDYNKPMYFSEYGMTDYGGTTDSNWKNWNKYNFMDTVLKNVDNYMKQKNYIHSVYWFRMFDFPPAATSFAACGEPNMGVIESDGTVKNLGKTVYYIFNGSNYTGSNQLFSW